MSTTGETRDIPFELPPIPDTWQWTTIGEIADIVSGVTKGQRHNDGASLREVPYLRVANVQRGFLDLSEMKTIRTTEDKIEKLRLQVGDVLFNEGGDRDKLGRGWVWNGEIDDCIHQNHVFRARLPEGLNPKFISFHANFFGRDWFWRHATQSINLASINQTILRQFPTPIAPANEQDRIVAKIEELFSDLDASVAALQRAMANLKRYRAAALKAAVEGRFTQEWRRKHPDVEPASELLKRILTERRRKWEADKLAEFEAKGRKPPKNWRDKYKAPAGPDTSALPRLPETWCWASVDQCAKEVTVGHVGSMKDEYVETGIPFLRSQNVRPLRYDKKGLRFVQPEFDERLAKSRLFGGELLLVRSGNIGDACVYPHDEPPANCSDLVITRTLDGLNAQFAAAFLTSPLGQSLIGGKRTGSALTHYNVSAMKSCPLALPPESEQHLIVTLVDEHLSAIEQSERIVETDVNRVNHLRQSVLQKAFAGKLVPQDPDDEPAVKLLERVAKEQEAASERPSKNKGVKKKMPKTRRSLRDVLEQHPDGMSPEDLLKESGRTLENIEQFYRELREISDVIEEIRPVGESTNQWPSEAQITLRLRSA